MRADPADSPPMIRRIRCLGRAIMLSGRRREGGASILRTGRKARMQSHEYTVVPAPSRGEKAPGLKTTADRFAHTLAELLNRMAVDGWDYVRAETLPAEERSGIAGRNTVWQNVLIFRRPIAAADPRRGDAPAEHAAPSTARPAPSRPEPVVEKAVPAADPGRPEPASQPRAEDRPAPAPDTGASETGKQG